MKEQLTRSLPQYTIEDLNREWRGKELPEGCKLCTHYDGETKPE